MKPGHWYMMYSNGLIETLYFQYFNELRIVEDLSFQNNPGCITVMHITGPLFTVVKAK